MAEKILIIGPSWVGDMMMSQSLYQALMRRHPDTQIHVMAPDWCRPLLAAMPQVSKAIAMPLGHGKLELGVRRKLGHQLRSEHYDQAIILPGSLKSALVPWFARIPIRTGWKGEMRYGLLNDLRVLDKQAFPLMVERYTALAYDADQMRSGDDIPELTYPALSITAEQQQNALAQYKLNADAIVFCPGAEFGPAKRWPDYHYAALAEQLIADGETIWLFGSDKDQPIGRAIIEHLPEKMHHHIHNLAGETTLADAIALMATSKAVVTNDSGLMHIAAALQRPLVALFGPTSPQFTPPLSEKAKILRMIEGDLLKVRQGDAAQGYHQSLIDLKPEMVQDSLYQLIRE